VSEKVLIGRILPGGEFRPSTALLAISRAMGRSPLDFHGSPGPAEPIVRGDAEAAAWEVGAGVGIRIERDGDGLAVYGIVDPDAAAAGLAFRADGADSEGEQVDYDVDPAYFMPTLISMKR
jgi:hypothetical protein